MRPTWVQCQLSFLKFDKRRDLTVKTHSPESIKNVSLPAREIQASGCQCSFLRWVIVTLQSIFVLLFVKEDAMGVFFPRSKKMLWLQFVHIVNGKLNVRVLTTDCRSFFGVAANSIS